MASSTCIPYETYGTNTENSGSIHMKPNCSRRSQTPNWKASRKREQLEYLKAYIGRQQR